MNFNWRDWRRPNIPKEELIETVAGLGIPGLVLLGAMALNPYTGGAAIVTALATLGGPAGMLGGIAVLVLIGSAIHRFKISDIFKRVLEKLIEKGKTKGEILQTISTYKIPNGLKSKIRSYIEDDEYKELDEYEELEIIQLSERLRKILSILEPHIDKNFEQLRLDLNEKIDKDIGKLELLLNDKIEDVKKDLDNKITRLKWLIIIVVAVGSIVTGGIVALIVGFLN